MADIPVLMAALNERYSLVRCNDHKQAIQRHSKEDYVIPTIDELMHNHLAGGMTGILAGERSKFIEIMDFDLKNAKDPAAFMNSFISMVKTELGEEFFQSMVVQTTPSGGQHWIYKTENVKGNKKISRGENKEAIVESRGNGGYFIIDPSKGYTIRQGSLLDIASIYESQRDQLWMIAKSLEEYDEPETRMTVIKHSHNAGALTNEVRGAFDNSIDYWEKFNVESDYRAMLEEDGWKVERTKGSKYLLRRPNKDQIGWSADLDMETADVPLLYVYSSSTVLESEKAYAASSYLIHYRFNGDAVKAYDWMIDNGHAPERKVHTPKTTEETKKHLEGIDSQETFDKYRQYMVNMHTKVERPVPIVTIGGVGVLHTGELLTLSGESKSGKSALLSAIIAKVINPDAQGFHVIKTENTKYPILHFDTEQPLHRHKDNLVYNIMKRAKIDEHPAQLLSYNLRRVGVDTRRIMVSELVESAKKHFGGVFMLILDGIADFITDTNSIEQSASIVDWMLQISTEYNCGVINVIHLNPSPEGGFIKQRGHLGSELQRKTDSLLIVKKDTSTNMEQSILSAHYLRNGGIFEFGQHTIFYDQETRMHQLLDADTGEVNPNATDKYKVTARRIGGMTVIDASKELYKSGHATSLITAQRSIQELIKFGYMVEEGGVLLIKSDLTTPVKKKEPF